METRCNRCLVRQQNDSLKRRLDYFSSLYVSGELDLWYLVLQIKRYVNLTSEVPSIKVMKTFITKSMKKEAKTISTQTPSHPNQLLQSVENNSLEFSSLKQEMNLHKCY